MEIGSSHTAVMFTNIHLMEPSARLLAQQGGSEVLFTFQGYLVERPKEKIAATQIRSYILFNIRVICCKSQR